MPFILKIISLVLIFTGISLADVQKIKDKAYISLEEFLNNGFENTDISIKSREKVKPEISIRTLKPILKNDAELTFFQGSFFTHDSDPAGGIRETLNLGLGKRILKDDENLMLGINTFYDHEFDYNHKRASVGVEIQSSILELNMNNYFAISGQKEGKNNVTEEALDGYDLEIGAHAPYIPTWKFFTKMFEFEVPDGDDLEGYKYSSEFLLPNSGVTLEVGKTDYSHSTDEWFVGIKYSFNDIDQNRKLIKNEAYERKSMKDQMEKKVRRENIIAKASGFAVKAGGF